jgi:hypothetical protein
MSKYLEKNKQVDSSPVAYGPADKAVSPQGPTGPVAQNGVGSTDADTKADAVFYPLLDHVTCFSTKCMPFSAQDILFLVSRAYNEKELLLFKTLVNSFFKQFITSDGKYPLNCKECKQFFKTYILLVGKDGKGPLDDFVTDNGPLKSLMEFVKSKPVSKCHTAIHIVEPGLPPTKSGGYDHFTFRPNKSTKSDLTPEQIRIALKQHHGTLGTIVASMYHPEMKKSVDILVKNLPSITYGNKLEHSATVFMTVSKETDSKTTLELMMTLLFAFGIVVGPNNDIICMALKQFKDNVLDALEVAHNIQSLKGLLSARFNPSTYLKSTALPTEQGADMAKSLVLNAGIQCMKVMDWNDFSKYGGIYSPSSTPPSSASHFFSEQIQTKSKTGRGGAAGFASRAASDTRLPTFTSIRAMMEYLKQNPHHIPQYEFLFEKKAPTGFVSTFETDENPLTRIEMFYKLPHSVSFHHHPVDTGLIPGSHHTLTGMFIVETSPNPSILVYLHGMNAVPDPTNNIHAELLRAPYQAKCGASMEQFNKQPMSRPMPESSTLAIGSSAKDAIGNLNYIWYIRIKGTDKVFSISKM